MAEGDRHEAASGGKPQPDLKVTDRRHFTATGDRRGDVADEPEDQAAPSTTTPQDSGSTKAFERHAVEEPEGVDFTMLINAMAQPALYFLGEVPHPGSGKPTVDLEQARLQIDMLDLLRVKCRGNLSVQEEGLLDRVLYQLRMLYVSRSGKPS